MPQVSKSSSNSAPPGLFAAGWPPITNRAPFNLVLDTANDYSYHNPSSDTVVSHQPKDLFQTATQLTQEISTILHSDTDKTRLHPTLDATTRTALGYVVYGSNRIENVGMDLPSTLRLCELVFSGSLPPHQPTEAYSSTLEAFLASDIKKSHSLGEPPPFILSRPESPTHALILPRREVTQHALALQHLLIAFSINGAPLTSTLIKTTHHILCDRIESASSHASSKYAGIYRTKDAWAGTTRFTKPAHIQSAMASLVRNLAADTVAAEKSARLDPFMLAAKYCDRFVNVHPFADGNGRVCRIILNAILLRYAGVVVAIGSTSEWKDRYLQIAMRSGQGGGYPGELGTLVLQGAVDGLRKIRGELVDCEGKQTGVVEEEGNEGRGGIDSS